MTIGSNHGLQIIFAYLTRHSDGVLVLIGKFCLCPRHQLIFGAVRRFVGLSLIHAAHIIIKSIGIWSVKMTDFRFDWAQNFWGSQH